MTPKLLNCPKCGGKAKTKRIIDISIDKVIVDYLAKCTNCEWTKIKRKRRFNRDMAVREWNVCVKEELKNEKNKSQ